MHVLIIEDYPMIAAMIEGLLRDLGYTSFYCASREDEAIEAALVKCPDLITADIQLTAGNGIEAVRSTCAQRIIPVIIIAAEVTEAERASIPKAIILPKPFSEDAFRQAIGDAILAIRRKGATAGEEV